VDLTGFDWGFGRAAAEGEDEGEWARAWAALLWTFVAAAAYTLASTYLPWLRSFPVLSWVRRRLPLTDKKSSFSRRANMPERTQLP